MKKFYRYIYVVISLFLLGSCTNYSLSNESKLSTGNLISLNKYYEQIGEKILYSLDKGVNWQTSDVRLIEFDIWDVKVNKEVPGMIFFYATTFDQLLEEVEKNRIPSIFTYNYLDNDGWDNLIKTYDEDYFEDNILLFYYKYEPNISTNYVYNVVIDDNELTLNVNRFEGMWTALSSWLEIVTITKADVENVTDFNVHVRTISELVSSVVLSASEEYIRDIYINGLSVSDFPGLDNLKSVEVWTSGLTLDIHFNKTISDDELISITEFLRSSENIRSVGYASNTWIRVVVSDKFYDEYENKTLTLYDIVKDEIEDSDNFTIVFKEFTHIVLITLKMDQSGRKYYEAMINQLNDLKYPFIDYFVEVH